MKIRSLMIVFYIAVALSACVAAPQISSNVDPTTIRFSGDRAFNIEKEFVTTYTYRHSGTEQSRKATEWLRQQYTAAGWNCAIDTWEIVNYSRPVPLRNVVCKLAGLSPREILVVAHHDQAPTTIQGATNDGSGIAILLELAEIFAREKPLKYTLVFVATDAEEYGMIGSRHYIQTHPNPKQINAGISLDNQGMYYYDSMIMELIGQFKGYGPIWLALTAKNSAKNSPKIKWEVKLRSVMDQVLDQAVPISFMDEGPMVAAGVPAIGLSTGYPAEYSDENYRLWHDPDDTIERQSPDSLAQGGLITEALIRQLLAMDSVPSESGPYLYFDNRGQILRGIPLYLIFVVVVGLFFLKSFLTGRISWTDRFKGWLAALPHFLGLWLPLVASILLLYLLVELRIMDKYHLYPATTKDPALLHPRWLAVILFLLGLGIFLFLGRWLARKFSGKGEQIKPHQIQGLAYFIVGLAGIYTLVTNPFTLLFYLPLLFWFAIRSRKRLGKILDVLLFLLGGLMIYALIYFFGFLTLRYGWLFLWMVLNMLSCRMISFPTALVSMAIIAAGLSMIVNSPREAVTERS